MTPRTAPPPPGSPGSTEEAATLEAATLEAEALDAYSTIVASVARHLLPSVASLEVHGVVGGGRRPVGSGSAVALTPDGFLVTSAHVVGRAGTGRASFADGRRLDFEVVGADPLSDLAVVHVGADDLPAAELGDAAQLRIGQLVVAVGSPLGFTGSVSAGVVSGLGRSLPAASGRHVRIIEQVIQTDAALHPGSSGGALADSRGRVVGINTALVGPTVGQGLGLAVPINETTRHLVAALLRDGRVPRAFLGVGGGTRPLPPRAARATARTHGVELLSVVTGSPADRAGLRPEDIVVELDGEHVASMGDLQRITTRLPLDRAVTVRFVRGGELRAAELHPVRLDDG